jgi:hypothetical protein
MQGHLKDLSNVDREEFSFVICERVISKIHEMVYDESTYFSSGTRPSSRKLPPHLNASLVGIGAIASAIGLPSLTLTLSDTVLKQARLGSGRRERCRNLIPRDEDAVQDDAGHPIEGQSTHISPSDSDREDSDVVTASVKQFDQLTKPVDKNRFLSPSPLDMLKRHRLPAARTNPSLPLSLLNARNGSKSLDFRIDDELRKSPHMSSPSLPLSKQASPGFDGDFLDPVTQSSLLRKHYLQTEVGLLFCHRICDT